MLTHVSRYVIAVRIRPPLKSTDPGFDLIPQRFQRPMVHATSPTSLSVDSPQGRKLFVFDKVFGEDVHQDGVWEYLSESIGAFVQGYNVSVMAYGQSGAGKSYTMGTSGPAEQSDLHHMGVIPRAAKILFEKLSGPPVLNRHGSSGIRTPTRYSTNSVHTLQSLAKAGSERPWQLVATYVEIYNEQLRDLLVPEHVPYGERNIVTIREDPKGRILLTGLHQVNINSVEDLLGALNFGSTIRQTDSTAVNAKSSRSHAVFSLNLIQRKTKSQPVSAQEKRYSMPLDSMSSADNWIKIDSKLHFVDLAGSERLKHTGASGERAREGISINAGLASLGKVISQLSSRQAGAHVSYRDSKLTRLLQDSLGGNAITYMIACVTPPEFHLSETLNTIQYAQRARAIQSKPRIHQVSEESDKQALIDRLRAEVSFLREQIRNSENGDYPSDHAQKRTERHNEREIELQNHLLDIQENYSALSQRHAKLISEITKAGDGGSGETPTLNGALGDSAVERLKRSNSFAEAVEQVVLEYEKTIQSLETSLSNTRSSLSTTESSLLERESKCASVETVNQQLQARIQKLLDRESSTEQYLHDLEARLDGRASGDERNSEVMTELRKEITRIRENEANSEEYISTLEERLAESDQDMELMQREISRLEHVVERQRSLGKLDNLLYELNHIQPNGKPPVHSHLTNGASKDKPGRRRVRGTAEATLREAMDTAIPESDEEEGEHPPAMSPDFQNKHVSDVFTQSPAQSNVLAEKFESVTQELFDLRVEHESTVDEYDMLSAKYEEALRTLAELQDAVDESRGSSTRRPATLVARGPPSFLEDARVKELKEEGQLPSSRSLSSELSSAGVSPTTTEYSQIGMSKHERNLDREVQVSPSDKALIQEMEHLKSLGAEREEGMKSLHEKYIQLQEQHMDTLDLVEELRAEVHKAKLSAPTTPVTPVIIRRRSNQNITTIDRAHRSLASLGNIASENFEDKPDTMQSFELNLNTAMHELHQRSERVQALEAELSNVKKDLETKMTMISGLTRERSSRQGSSPIDISVVSSMQDQLIQSENQIRILHETYAAKEQELMNEICSLKDSLSTHSKSARSSESEKSLLSDDSIDAQVSGLRDELSLWENKHRMALERMESSEKKLLSTIAGLEVSLATVQSLHHDKSVEFDTQGSKISTAITEREKERAEHAETVKSLDEEIGSHKATIDTHLKKINELEVSYGAAQKTIEEGLGFREAAKERTKLHHEEMSRLEEQVMQHQSDVEFHKHGLKSLHDSLRQVEVNADARIAELNTQHDENIKKLHEDAEAELKKTTQMVQKRVEILEANMADIRRDLAERESVIKELREQQQTSAVARLQISSELDRVTSRLSAAESAKVNAEVALGESQAHVERLVRAKEDLMMELADLREKEQRASRLVEELEGELSSTFEDNRTASTRLSAFQTIHNAELQEAHAAAAKAQEEKEALIRRLEQFEVSCHMRNTQLSANESMKQRGGTTPHVDNSNEHSVSMSSNVRKSSTPAKLPSPPPAIPLPPLPTTGPNHPPNAVISGSPPDHNHSTRDLVSAQVVEDQEARIRTIEKHLFAEKQLTATLEEALIDLETQGHKVKADMEAWKKQAKSYEIELQGLRKERNSHRSSLQAVEEEKHKRKEAEAARAHLEERMAALSKKKKKSALNCF